jgi:hypothetical protein
MQHKIPWGLQDQPKVSQVQSPRKRQKHDPTPEHEAEDQPKPVERQSQIDEWDSAGTASRLWAKLVSRQREVGGGLILGGWVGMGVENFQIAGCCHHGDGMDDYGGNGDALLGSYRTLKLVG